MSHPRLGAQRGKGKKGIVYFFIMTLKHEVQKSSQFAPVAVVENTLNPHILRFSFCHCPALPCLLRLDA
jgi:hypothetical protein